jgi:hypothetical protein
MKKLFKKPWFTGVVIIGIMLVVFLLNLWILSINLVSPYRFYDFWTLADGLSSGGTLNLFAFIMTMAFYLLILIIPLSGISFFKKNNWGYLTAGIYLFVFGLTLIIFQVLFQYLATFALILTIVNIILLIGAFVLIIYRNKFILQSEEIVKTKREIDLSKTKIPLTVLIIDIISIVVFLTTFIIPLFSLEEVGDTYNAVLIKVLLSGDTNLISLIYFFVSFAILLYILFYFANSLSHYFFDKEKFIKESKTLVTSTFIASLTFFLTGVGVNIYYTLTNEIVSTIAYIPLLLMIVVVFAHAIFRGKFSAYYQITTPETRVKFANIESLFYTILLSAVSILMLFLPIIKINITANSYEDNVSLTGFDILKDYANLDKGYHMVAFVLVVMLITVGVSLVVAISSYLSKYKQFSTIVKTVTSINVFFVFIIAISGYYFQIAKEIDQAVIMDIFDYYGVNLPSSYVYDYTITTDAIYALIASVTVLVIMFIRKAFDQEDVILIAPEAPGEDNGNNNSTANSSNGNGLESDEDLYQNFDPCPAFTLLDSKADEYKQDLERRKKFKAPKADLNDLVNFVVEYARNSRLHLSYTPEDIATFVAGLGASRLSILQGMSGTGKTSLPKIFSEAILGNCEIVEVESSWKDKNELLGYYNEFSMKYTPKKFTIALYKAALNKEICTFILLDEMNLSRIEYYFSDFLSLMENEEGQRDIKLVNIKLTKKENETESEYLALDYSNTLKVPSNVWFIGTANRDESTFVISDKVYDRAHTMNFTKRAPKVRNYSDPIPQRYFDYNTINELFIKAKKEGDFDAENSQLIKNVETLLAPFNISFGNRILKQIEDFVNIYKACFKDKNVEDQAIEKILLSKVVAKLEVKAIDDKEKLEMEFEKLNLNQCVDFIRRLDNE